jgi:hypothetical protein
MSNVLASVLPLVWALAAPSAVSAAPSAVSILPPYGSEDTCPNARQVTEALQAHLPGQILSPERAGAPMRTDTLRAVLDVPADGTVVHFSLIDGHDEVQLRRSIPAPGRGRPAADCLALAETLAVIVDRYLSSVPYQAAETAPPPPPPPRVVPPGAQGQRPAAGLLRLYVGGAWRMSSANPSLLEGRVGADAVVSTTRLRLAASLRLGFDQEERVDWMTGDATLRRFPGRVGLLVEIPAGPGVIEPTLEAGVDLFIGRRSDSLSGQTDQAIRWSPVVGAEVGYRIALPGHLFLRPRASLGFAIVRYNIATGPADAVAFQTSTVFSALGLDAGLVFR